MCDKENNSVVSVTKRKREKPEDFVGWVSPDGLLKVVELLEKGKHPKYKVTCEICSQDTLMFPLGYFIRTKYELLDGKKPCGCAKNTRWTEEQWMIRANDAAKDRFKIQGFAEKFKGKNTKVNCECVVDAHKWQATLGSIVNSRKQGCIKCAGKYKPTEDEAIEKCKQRCEGLDYTFIGIVGRYKNKDTTDIEFLCPKHGKQTMKYHSFIWNESKCRECGRDKLRVSEEDVIIKCKEICERENYKFIGFNGGFKGTSETRIQYACPLHGVQTVRYSSFIYQGSKCPACWREISPFYGWYPERAEEQDFLYVLKFNYGEYIKVGRSFDVDNRMGELKRESNCVDIEKCRVYTALHKEIYPLEQELHEELRERGFEYIPDNWYSMETFDSDCLFILNKLLDICGENRVY